MDKEGNKFLSRQFKSNSSLVAGSNVMDRKRNVIQPVNVSSFSAYFNNLFQGVELRFNKASDGIVPKLFAIDDIDTKSGSDFGAFRPTISHDEGGYNMTYDQEKMCKYVIPYQTAPSLR
jgi:hypothetical protein